MRRAVLLILAAVGATAALTHASSAARAEQCGLPDARPLWFDYAAGAVSFRNEVFGRPGVIAATSGISTAAELRNRGAQTVYWENKLGSYVGATSAPADPAGMPAVGGKLFDRAVASSGCQTPLILLNELNGPGLTTPWTPNNAQYRGNVLTLIREVAGRGARPYLLLPAAPYTGGDALDWWRQVAQAAYIVPEVYFNAPRIMRMGVVIGSRKMRTAYRQAIANLTSIGVQPARLGLVIGFQSGPGKGGREGLQPSTEWLRFVKLQTLAARQVAGELGLGGVVSWGWGTFDTAGADADKPKAACVYLWARNQQLCDGPRAAGAGFNPSLEEGQIILPPGARCALDGKAFSQSALGGLAALTGDADVALTAVYERLVESLRAPVSTQSALEAERSIVARRFGGSMTAYVAELRRRGATLGIARGIIADQLRRAAIAQKLPVGRPSAAEIASFYATYPDLPVRRLKTTPAASWLGGRREGLALVPPAPGRVLTLLRGRASRVLTSEGSFVVTPMEDAVPLGAVPLPLARPAIRAALVSFARAQAFESWTIAAQRSAHSRLACARDALPTPAAVDLTFYLPFLTLDA